MQGKGTGNSAMTMSNGNSGSMASEINVTPMIDVLLVLLIIFMVIVPALPRGEAAQTPAATKNRISEGSTVVLEMLKGTAGELSFKINRHEVSRQDLAARLTEIYANRAQRVLFVKGDDRLSFAEVAQVIDLGHSAGVDHIGLMTPKVLAGQ
jgi:biopolymer transport protein TolR